MPPHLEERTVAGLHDFLEREIIDLPRSTAILDLGCGSGAWLARLRSRGYEDLWGIDAGAQPQVKGLSFIQANLDYDRPRIEKRFGLITLIEVIEHLENPGAALRLISEHLSNDGVALITSPNIHSLRSRLKFMLTGQLASFDEKGDPTHITPVLLSGICKVAAHFGLTIERCWTYPLRKSLIFGAPIRSAAAMLRLVAPDPLPGDTLCLRLNRRAR